MCKCSPGYTGAECISAADQSGKIIKDEEKFQDDLKRQLFLQDQVPSPHGIPLMYGHPSPNVYVLIAILRKLAARLMLRLFFARKQVLLPLLKKPLNS